MLVATLGPGTEERSGDWYYRITQPMQELSKFLGVYTVDCAYIHRAVPEILDKADVVIVNMLMDRRILESLQVRRQRGQVTIFELNDELAHLPVASGLSNDRIERRRMYTKYMSEFDGVQFTTPELARRYGRYTRRYFVVGNYVDQALVKPRIPHKGFVVGWGGSLGHLEDLVEIAPTLIDWIQSKPDSALSLMCDQSLHAPFWKLKPARLIPQPIAGIDGYFDWLATLDVGFAHLRWDEFNYCRSDVKWLEFSSAGVPSVVREMEPYRDSVQHGVNGMTYSTGSEFVDALERLYNEPATRTRLAQAASKYVAQERSPEAGARIRLDAYLALLPWDPFGARDTFRSLSKYGQVSGNRLPLRFGDQEWETWRKMVEATT